MPLTSYATSASSALSLERRADLLNIGPRTVLLQGCRVVSKGCTALTAWKSLAWLFGFRLHEVVVFEKPKKDRCGTCVVSEARRPDELLLYTVAGPVAEAIFGGVNFNIARMCLGGSLYLGGRNDFHDAVEISRAMHWRPTDELLVAIEGHMAEVEMHMLTAQALFDEASERRIAVEPRRKTMLDRVTALVPKCVTGNGSTWHKSRK